MVDQKQNIYAKACTEVWYIISQLKEDLNQKIPKEIKDVIYKNRDLEYNFTLDTSFPIEEGTLLPETKGIISVLWSDYFCSEIEKEKWKKYDEFYQQKIVDSFGEQYGIETLFKKINTEERKDEPIYLKPIEESIWAKVRNKVRSLIHKR